MRYSDNVISRTLRSLAIAVPLSLAVAVPAAHAGSSYKPAVNAITVTGCDWDTLSMAVDGAQPNSPVAVHIVFSFKSGPDTVLDYAETATGTSGQLGSSSWSKSVPIPSNATVLSAKITATLVNGGPLSEKTTTLDRVGDCGLPETGSNTAPIGQIALGVTLGGGLLAAVALRRRPRKSNAAA